MNLRGDNKQSSVSLLVLHHHRPRKAEALFPLLLRLLVLGMTHPSCCYFWACPPRQKLLYERVGSVKIPSRALPFTEAVQGGVGASDAVERGAAAMGRNGPTSNKVEQRRRHWRPHRQVWGHRGGLEEGSVGGQRGCMEREGGNGCRGRVVSEQWRWCRRRGNSSVEHCRRCFPPWISAAAIVLLPY